MKLHEYQGKQLFAASGIQIPRGITAKTPEEALAAYETLMRQGAGTSVSVKAQLHAGGRGKAGGVPFRNLESGNARASSTSQSVLQNL